MYDSARGMFWIGLAGGEGKAFNRSLPSSPVSGIRFRGFFENRESEELGRRWMD